MSIVYDWYENPNAEGDPEERGLHPRPLLNGKVTTVCPRACPQFAHDGRCDERDRLPDADLR